MTSPDIVVLDTRGAHDKAGFLAACARDLRFPEYFGGNWDAFEECVRDLGRGPTLIVWTGSIDQPADVRDTAVQIFTENLADGVDLLVVDDVSPGGSPDFVALTERITIPQGALAQAEAFWGTLGLRVQDGVFDGSGLTLHLVQVAEHHPGVGPVIGVADPAGLRARIVAAGLPFAEDGEALTVSDPFGTLITFTPY